MKYALVTGATRGIGRAIVETIVSDHRVCGVYRSQHQAAKALATQHGIEMLATNLGTSDGIERVVEAIKSPLDAVVFNAGIAKRAAFTESGGLDPLRHQLEYDLWAPLELCRRLLAYDKIKTSSPNTNEHGASLVFISSNLARHGLSHKVAYSAAKSGLEGAVRGLAKEFGPSGIRVNAVAPGLLQTDMTSDLEQTAITAYEQTVPLGRIGQAQDIAPLVSFLLSDQSAYISGQVIDVDGGWGC